MTVLASAAPALIAVLLVAAAGKARDVRGFAATIAGYRVLPRGLTMPAAALVLTAEAGAAGLLAVPATRRWGGLVAAGLFTTFLAAMATVIHRGLNTDCGCFGSRPSPVGPATMVRTGALLLVAIVAAVAGPAPVHLVSLMVSALLLGAMMLLSRPGDPAQPSPRDDPMRLGRRGGPPDPDRHGGPAGPSPGSRFAPTAPTPGGGHTLFALISPECGVCTAMLPKFAAAATKTRVVFVSARDEPSIRAHLTAHDVNLPIVVVPDVYEANDIPWPPYAIITDATGTILAAGGADSPERLDALLRTATRRSPAA